MNCFRLYSFDIVKKLCYIINTHNIIFIVRTFAPLDEPVDSTKSTTVKNKKYKKRNDLRFGFDLKTQMFPDRNEVGQ